jgi:signal transduction histidine kinase/CheY-like chemotaxis protein
VLSGLFNPASVSALLSAVISAIAAACAFLLGRVPDWDDLRPLTWIALTAALASGCNFTATLDVPVEVYAWTGRLQVLAMALHVVSWHVYLVGWGRRPLGSRHRLALRGLAAIGLLALVPGVVYADAVSIRPLAWMGVTYHDPVLTPTGFLVYGVVAVFGAWGCGLSYKFAREGAPFPVAHAICTSVITAMAVHDALVLSGLPLPTPYLVDFAFYGPITMLGLVTITRIGVSATDLRHLSAGLARLVAERSAALQRSEAALARAERLAALGQFAAGVAHEVNNPAAVVASSLEYLAAELGDDPRDGVQAGLREARAGVQRITGIVRQLLVAGRTAGRSEEPVSPVHAASVVEAAVTTARARAGGLVAFDEQVAPGLTVLAHRDSLIQVLSNLAINAAQAYPPGQPGVVTIRGEHRGAQARLVVEDAGVGMSEEALLHVFEPFYSTKPSSMGTGLGMAVSLGLVNGMGGSLRFESALGVGTRAILELGRSTAPEVHAEPAPPPGEPVRARILVIDDDPEVLTSMARLLGRTHEVRVAGGVWEGLQALGLGEVDLILCDVLMPGGGAERFWAELPLRAAWAPERVAFMTAGAATPESRAFLAGQDRPVLAKPFDQMAVQDVLAELREAGRLGRRPVGRVKPG